MEKPWRERYCILPDHEISWKCSKRFEPEDPTQHPFCPPTPCDSSNTGTHSVYNHESAVGQLPITFSFILHELPRSMQAREPGEIINVWLRHWPGSQEIWVSFCLWPRLWDLCLSSGLLHLQLITLMRWQQYCSCCNPFSFPRDAVKLINKGERGC